MQLGMAAVEESSGSRSSPRVAPEVVKATQRDGKELTNSFFKLNPYAKEFVPNPPVDAPEFVGTSEIPLDYSGDSNQADANLNQNEQEIRRIGTFGNPQGGRRLDRQHWWRWTNNAHISQAHIEDCIQRTVYVSHVEQYVTEEELAEFFSCCGQINDCRISGEPGSALNFAFIEFSFEESARAALNFRGALIHETPINVAPSKSNILPINPSYLPRGAHEGCMVRRTVYCNNIDKKISENEIRDFFESYCGPISRLRLLGEKGYPTRIAFIEFAQDDGATAALWYTGFYLGAFPVRIIPSKTPVRSHPPASRQH